MPRAGLCFNDVFSLACCLDFGRAQLALVFAQLRSPTSASGRIFYLRSYCFVGKEKQIIFQWCPFACLLLRLRVRKTYSRLYAATHAFSLTLPLVKIDEWAHRFLIQKFFLKVCRVIPWVNLRSRLKLEEKMYNWGSFGHNLV